MILRFDTIVIEEVILSDTLSPLINGCTRTLGNASSVFHYSKAHLERFQESKTIVGGNT